MHIYQVHNWSVLYENNKSRERDKCSYVCVPNKQDGLGLTRILSEEDGISIYGIWCLILGMCSRQSKPREGYLTEDGRRSGQPQNIDDLALRWRRKPHEIERALEFLSSSKIGWISRVYLPNNKEVKEQSARSIPDRCPTSANGHVDLPPPPLPPPPPKKSSETIETEQLDLESAPEGNRREEKGIEKSIKKEKIHVSQIEVEDYCESIGLPREDGEWFWCHFEGQGWMNKGQPVKCWKGTCRAWKIAKFLPSLKISNNGRNGFHQKNSGTVSCAPKVGQPYKPEDYPLGSFMNPEEQMSRPYQRGEIIQP